MKESYFHGGISLIKNLVGIKVPFLFGHTITWRCNYKCPFCYGRGYDKSGNELNTKEVKDLIDQAWDLGCVTYSVTGGEPLLRKDLPELLKYAMSVGALTDFVTNGFFVEKRIHEFKNYVDYVFISLDFPDERHSKSRGNPQAFTRVVKAIKLLKNEGIKTHLSSVITKQNLNCIPEILNFAKNMDVGVSFMPVTEFEFDRRTFSPATKQYREMISKIMELKSAGEPVINSYAYLKLLRDGGKFICRNTLVLSVDPYGNVTVPCATLTGIGIGVSNVGDVKEKPLKEIWFSEKAGKNREKMKECNKCYAPCFVEPSLSYDIRNILSTLQTFLDLS